MATRKTTAKRNGKPEGLRGAPRKFDRTKVVKAICARLATGEPMAVICRDLEVPVRTVNDWRAQDADIAAQFDEARDLGHEAIAYDCMAIADNQKEHHQSRRVRIETRLKLLAKWDPRRWGDKLITENTNHTTVEIVDTDEMDRRLDRAIAAACAAGSAVGAKPD